MQKRPISLTIVAWLFIVASCATAVLTITAINDPITLRLMKASSVSLTIAVLLQGLAIIANITIAVGILRRCSWSRRLYVGSTILGLGYTIATTSSVALVVIPAALAALAFTYILYRRPASEYFDLSSHVGVTEVSTSAGIEISKAA